MLAAQAAGQLQLFPFDQYLEQELFDPNTLNPSAFCQPSDIFDRSWAPDQAKDDPKYATNHALLCHVSDIEEASASKTDVKISSEHLLKAVYSDADSETYTCTYNRCTRRFKTKQMLQKHKREGHRNANAANTPTSLSKTSAALLERNSQNGSHRCTRINPATGKPCNSTFKRPYDFTRHEDTVHNTRKQKFPCVLCTKEKTFTRKDALSRHMRVHHPKIHPTGRASGR